jgi:F-type H+-transporting ATPase subunit gamma
MAGGQERILRRRIRSIQSTQKITRAMELIAASRIVRAQQAIAAARPYVEKMAEVVAQLARTPESRNHPLFREPETINRVAVISIAGDGGLSGAFNSSALRAAERVVRDHTAAGHEVMLVTVGRKGGAYFRYRNYEITQAFTGMADRPTVADARAVVATVMEPFAAGEIDQIDLVYTHFESMGRQEVRARTLVPISPDDSGPSGGSDAEAGGSTDGVAGRPAGFVVDYDYEPDPSELLDRLLPSWLQGELLAALLSSSASQYVARQRAMKAATDNADDLITSLSRVMNRARQDAITTEITEIVGGAEALRGGSDEEHYDYYEDPDAA